MSINTASENFWLCPMIGSICETHCAEIQLGEHIDLLSLLYKRATLLCENCIHGDGIVKLISSSI